MGGGKIRKLEKRKRGKKIKRKKKIYFLFSGFLKE
jgi:hypothetical protein